VSAPRRILFTAAGGHGHLQPLLPLAQQAAQAGHDVLITGAASLAAQATYRGLAFTATGPDLRPIHAPLVVHDVDEERRAVASYFVAKLGRSRAEAVLGLCRSWRPHVIVRDEVDFGAAVAAEAAGLPHVRVIVIGAGQFILRELVSDPLHMLLSEFGVKDVEGFDALHRHLTLTPFPMAFRSAGDPLPGKVFRYHVPAPPRAARSERTVFVTLGTIFNTESGDLLRTAALGAAACPTVERVVVATGEHVQPESLGRMPQQVAVHQFVQQDAILAECDAVISHAGSGTVLGALKQALPMVSLPMGADQQLNAARLDELGLGLSLRADATDVGKVREALAEVLASKAMRERLSRVAGDIAASPGPAEAIGAVEALVP
jgi:UDP:flavonoid glycosyltransferase YjiC (YdhE family)